MYSHAYQSKLFSVNRKYYFSQYNNKSKDFSKIQSKKVFTGDRTLNAGVDDGSCFHYTTLIDDNEIQLLYQMKSDNEDKKNFKTLKKLKMYFNITFIDSMFIEMHDQATQSRN